ncbi:MAG: hypothetical protein DA328_05725 [Nitrososphaeraceae archaeon]|nr:hypothetical protein [Nitrososphaeraceae archaeon]
MNQSSPDDIILKFISKNDSFIGKSIDIHVFPMLISYHFRNYAGHNIKQQKTVIINYKDIINVKNEL